MSSQEIFNLLFGLFMVVLGFTIARLVKDLDTNTKETKGLRTEVHALVERLITNFVNIKDWEYIRGRLHELGNTTQELKTKEELRTRREDMELGMRRRNNPDERHTGD